MTLRLKIPISSKLNLTNSTIDEARNMIHTFFSVNYSYGTYVEDQFTLSVAHPDFLAILDIITDRITRVRESRGALHIHIYDVPKEDIQLHHLRHFWTRIIPYDKYFGYYNLIICAHIERCDARHVHNHAL